MMTDAMRAILSEALTLPPNDRLLLADALVYSVPLDDSGLPEGWSEELDRRERDLESGAEPLLSREEAEAFIFRRDD